MIDPRKSLGKISKLQIILILLFFGLCVYSNAIFHPFVHDDVVFIEKNPLISTLDIKDIFFSPAPFSGSSDIANSYYRPLLDILYRIQYQNFGKVAYKYHLFNIFLHVLNAYLVYLILSFLLDEQMFALFGSLLFLIHPVQSEAVSCIVGVSNLLYFLLCSMSFYLYLLAKKDAKSFKKFVTLGGELRLLHLLESPKVNQFITSYPVAGSDAVEKIGVVAVAVDDKK